MFSLSSQRMILGVQTLSSGVSTRHQVRIRPRYASPLYDGHIPFGPDVHRPVRISIGKKLIILVQFNNHWKTRFQWIELFFLFDFFHQKTKMCNMIRFVETLSKLLPRIFLYACQTDVFFMLQYIYVYRATLVLCGSTSLGSSCGPLNH